MHAFLGRSERLALDALHSVSSVCASIVDRTEPERQWCKSGRVKRPWLVEFESRHDEAKSQWQGRIVVICTKSKTHCVCDFSSSPRKPEPRSSCVVELCLFQRRYRVRVLFFHHLVGYERANGRHNPNSHEIVGPSLLSEDFLRRFKVSHIDGIQKGYTGSCRGQRRVRVLPAHRVGRRRIRATRRRRRRWQAQCSVRGTVVAAVAHAVASLGRIRILLKGPEARGTGGGRRPAAAQAQGPRLVRDPSQMSRCFDRGQRDGFAHHQSRCGTAGDGSTGASQCRMGRGRHREDGSPPGGELGERGFAR
mmetsp:Transcript_16127/g.44660  ORF Transcript_16127/g.44660 Transcript_16127/m.44660 type:complete len:307 (+) Transcript_16127:267-1187(+)